MNNVRVYSKEERKLRKQLAMMICNVRAFEAKVDALFAGASPIQGVERGKELARLLNELTMANDQALYFGLGFDYRKDSKGKGANIKAIIKHGSKTREVI